MAFRTLYFISLCHIVSGISNLNQTAAREQCKSHGGLASYRHFIGNDGWTLDENMSLNEGESAWIYGGVKFSKFVAWHGCYTGNRIEILKQSLTENNIYNCLESCGDIANMMYIGIRKEWCYCIDDTHIRYSYLRAIPDNECKQQLIEPKFVSKNENSSTATINVYIIMERRRPSWDPISSAPFGQCVYAWIEKNEIRYMADSCFTLKAGFICLGSAYRAVNCSAVHGNVYKSDLFCVVTKSSSWLSSYKHCGQCHGKLAEYVHSHIKVKLNPNATFWTGIFRSFKLDDANVSDNLSVCLSLKKVDKRLALDPADCSARKAYICGDDISKNTESTLKTTYSHKETKSATKGSYLTTAITTNPHQDTKSVTEGSYLTTAKTTNPHQDTESVTEGSYLTTAITEKNTTFSATLFPPRTTMSSKDKEKADGKTGPTSAYIAVGVVVSVIVFAIVITCLILRKRHKLCKRGLYDKASSKDNHKNTAIDSNIGVGSATVSHGDVQRQVLTYQHNEAAEENEYATPDMVMIKSNGADCEYDRIDMNAPGKSNDNSTSAMLTETNVYGVHTGISYNDGTDEYDHLRAVGTKQSAKPMDGIYNTMSAESDTYNVLRLHSKERATDQPNDKQAQMSCSTYDKLD